MRTVIFDDRGRMRDAMSPALRAEFYGGSCDFDLTKYLLDNLGFVAVHYMNARTAQIRLRPETASSAAIAAVLFALWDEKPARLVVTSRGDGGTEADTICADTAAAAAHMASLVAGARKNGPQPFISRPITPREALKRDKPLAQLLRMWVDALGRFSPGEHPELFNGALQGRFMVVEAGGKSNLQIAEVGPGFMAFSPEWCRNAVGVAIENQPDYKYGLWVRERFASVADCWEPRFDEVDGILQRPHRDDRIRARYRRLILPYRDTDTNSDRLIGVSVTDESIDFRGRETLQHA